MARSYISLRLKDISAGVEAGQCGYMMSIGERMAWDVDVFPHSAP
jgi:hypothetical protein